MLSTKQAETIRTQNDCFRQSLPFPSEIPGRVFITSGILKLVDNSVAKEDHLADLFAAVRGYQAFDTANDPYHEHDFGSFVFHGQKCFWKIDYYDLALQVASADPSDLLLTTRMMTIMLAEEY